MMKDEFAKELQSLMSSENVKFSEGTFADNVDEIWDNYITQYYDVDSKDYGDLAYEWFYSTLENDDEGLFTQVNDGKRIFASELKKLMRKNRVTFSEGSFDENIDEIWDNYIMAYHGDEVESQGAAEVAHDWFENTIFDDEEGIFKRLGEYTSRRKNMNRMRENTRDSVKGSFEDYMDSEEAANMIQETYDNFVRVMRYIRAKYVLSISDEDIDVVADDLTEIALNPGNYS